MTNKWWMPFQWFSIEINLRTSIPWMGRKKFYSTVGNWLTHRKYSTTKTWMKRNNRMLRATRIKLIYLSKFKHSKSFNFIFSYFWTRSNFIFHSMKRTHFWVKNTQINKIKNKNCWSTSMTVKCVYSSKTNKAFKIFKTNN